MARIFCNYSILNGEKIEVKNGATRRTLVLINKTGQDIEKNTPFAGDLGFLNKGNHSFVFINEPRKSNDNRTLFIIMNQAYGITVHNANPLFKEVSTGGYGNSESTLAVLPLGCIVEKHSYKNRNTPSFIELTETGIIEIPEEEAYQKLGEEIKEI